MNEIVAIRIPRDADKPEGPFSVGKAELLGQKDGYALARISEIDSTVVTWLEEYDKVVIQLLTNLPATVIRRRSEGDYKTFRVPLWIQSEEIPSCCGKPMFFVGQLDDNTICGERPDGVRYWWHDTASFYVFTCGECLECKAVGQQF